MKECNLQGKTEHPLSAQSHSGDETREVREQGQSLLDSMSGKRAFRTARPPHTGNSSSSGQRAATATATATGRRTGSRVRGKPACPRRNASAERASQRRDLRPRGRVATLSPPLPPLPLSPLAPHNNSPSPPLRTGK